MNRTVLLLPLLLPLLLASACSPQAPTGDPTPPIETTVPGTEVMLVGAIHVYPEGQDAGLAVDRMAAFGPGIVLVETPMPDDAFGLERGWTYSEMMPLLEAVLDRHSMRTRTAGDTARVLLAAHRSDPGDLELHARLLHAFLLDTDIANALLHGHLLFNRSAPDSAGMAGIERWLPVQRLRDYRVVVAPGQPDDFGQLILPLADRLGLTELYGFDSWEDVPAYEAAWTAADSVIRQEVAERAGVAPDSEEAARLLAEAVGVAHADSARRRAGRRGEMVRSANSRENDGIVRERHVARIRLAPEHGQAMKAAWDRRNDRMAANALEVLGRERPERAVVIVGASHLGPLEERLRAAGLSVRRLDPDPGSASPRN